MAEITCEPCLDVFGHQADRTHLRSIHWTFDIEQAMGIETTFSAWEDDGAHRDSSVFRDVYSSTADDVTASGPGMVEVFR
ncbi:MAG: hypothetical protein ACREV4_07205, partial [Gammaproteobacteria bacterium]